MKLKIKALKGKKLLAEGYVPIFLSFQNMERQKYRMNSICGKKQL